MILLENGYFYQPNQPNITAILIDGGCIVAVSKSSDELKQNYSIKERYDLKGKIVWPGMTDAHIHLTSYSLNLVRIDCETDTLQECLHRVETAAISAPQDAWILGHGWNQNSWTEGFGTAAQLDAVSHGHPIYLTAKSLHTAWANSKAMQSAGITTDTENPPGGKILRDRYNHPNGIFLESAAELIRGIIPKQSPDEITHAILKGIDSLTRMGITSVHDFDALNYLAYYNRLEQDGRLHQRILKTIPPDDHQEALESGLHTGKGNKLVQIGAYKYFMDGALGPHTAAMIEPYNDDNHNHGILNHTAEDIIHQCEALLKNTSDISIHAIGDRANVEAIKAFREIIKIEQKSGNKPVRKRIEHVQLLRIEDLAELQKLGITASMQPLHATSDMRMADKYWGSRSRYAYAWNSLLKHGTCLIFGSDAPVDSPNPFWGMHAAVTRQSRNNIPAPEGWIPEERITLKETLDAYTTKPADHFRRPSSTGRLEPGANADLILLSVDPFMEEARELHQIKPVATMFNGQWVWIDRGISL